MKSLLFTATVLLATLGVASDAPKITNAKVEHRTLSGSLEQQVRSISGPAWIGYSEPAVPRHGQMCCWNRGADAAKCCGACGLEKQTAFVVGSNESCQSLESSTSVLVMLRIANGQPEKVRIFSMDCPIDGGGMTVYLLEGVRAADSIRYLEQLAMQGTTAHRDDLGDGAIAAIAMHQDPLADQSLARLIHEGKTDKVVEQATFWTGNARGSHGYETLASELDRNDSTSFRKHAVFALSQNSDTRAQQKLIDLARHDSNSEIRGESLFWLAQEAGKKAAGVINSAIEDDPNTEVKKKAVFALSQLSEDEGVPLLIEQAKKNANPVVRKEAMFWLGQSHDPRALDYITSVLER